MPTYPLTLPDELKIKEIKLRKLHVVARNTSPFTLEAQSYEHAGESWQADLTFAPVSGVVSSLTAWNTGILYSIGQQRSTGGVNYECIVGHTSTTFSSDYAAGRWKRIEVFAAIGFYQDLYGQLGSFNLDVSAYDNSVSGDSTVAFRLVNGHAPPAWSIKEGNYYFDKLVCEEDL